MVYATKSLYYFYWCSYCRARSWALALLFLAVSRTFLDTALAKFWE